MTRLKCFLDNKDVGVCGRPWYRKLETLGVDLVQATTTLQQAAVKDGGEGLEYLYLFHFYTEDLKQK